MPHVLLTSGFDAAGNRDSLAATLYNGTSGTADFVNHYSYDELSRLIDIIQQGQTGGNAVATKQVYYTLDGIGDVTEMDRSSDATIGPDRSGPAYTTLGYNPQGLLTSIEHLHQSTALESMIWSYDNLDRVGSFQSNDGTATYGYDRLNEVTSASYTTAGGGHQPADEAFSFDSNGNRARVDGVLTLPASDNEVSNDGTFTYTFDADGNRLTRERDQLSPPQHDDLVSYTWDSRNRLAGVEDFSWNAASSLWVETEAVTYTYDVFDHLIQRVDEVIGGSTTTTQYVWDGDRIVLSFDNGVLAARYLNGPNTSAYDQYFSTLAEEDLGTGATTWDLLDDQGTLRDVIDGGGNVVDHLNYSSFGQLAYESAPTVAHLDGYAGGLYDPSTQLVYFIHRWYDPKATVWISADPMGFAAGDTNLTRYVDNATTLYVDPSGDVLIAVDGTGSKEWRRTRKPGEGYQSHVRNFYNDYDLDPGEKKFYWDGPDAWINGAADECGRIYRGVMSKLNGILEENPDEEINLIGHSRGGYIVMQVAWELKQRGYRVNYLGLYDPVDSAPGFGTSEKVPSNVDYCGLALSHWAARSRKYFNRADHGPEDTRKMKRYSERTFVGTHAALGGAPWAGDHPRGMTPDRDKSASEDTDKFLRRLAKEAGLEFDDDDGDSADAD